MTPLHLEIILHYHSRVNDWRDGDFSAPVAITYLMDLVDMGLLFVNPDYEVLENVVRFLPTERLHVFVKHLCKLPLPIDEWRSPIEELNKP